MDLQLNRKSAIVTGGSRGIGWAVADKLLDEGVHVVIAARTRHLLEVARAQLSGPHRRIHAFPCDTNDRASVEELVDYAVDTTGSIDILVNAAAQPGDPSPGPDALTCDPSRMGGFMEPKISGYLRCAQAAAPFMVERRWGRIINIGGTSAWTTGSVFGSVRNAGVVALTKNLADALGPHGITVTAVHPGLTRTERLGDLIAQRARRGELTRQEVMREFEDRTLLKRLPTAHDIAALITFLCSPLSVAVNGDSIPAMGGLPGAIHY